MAAEAEIRAQLEREAFEAFEHLAEVNPLGPAADLSPELRDAGFILPPPKLLVANISAGQLVTGMVQGLLNASIDGTIGYGTVLVESGPYLDDGRNRAVDIALTVKEWEWLLFIDSDVQFTSEDICTLFLPTRHKDWPTLTYPVIGGVYVNPFPDNGVPGEEGDAPNSHFGPVVYEWTERDDLPTMPPTWAYRRLSRSTLANWGLRIKPINNEPTHPVLDAVVPVHAIGTGFMAIHRSLLLRMQADFPPPCPWFSEPEVNGIHLGEDFGFCHRVRQMGYPVLANRACTPLHHHRIQLI